MLVCVLNLIRAGNERGLDYFLSCWKAVAGPDWRSKAPVFAKFACELSHVWENEIVIRHAYYLSLVVVSLLLGRRKLPYIAVLENSESIEHTKPALRLR